MREDPTIVTRYKIYCLKDPLGKIFYVGSTKSQYLSKRRFNHIDSAKYKLPDGQFKNCNTKDKYIRHCDYKFTIELLEELECNKESALDREDYYINHLKPFGNTTGARPVPPPTCGHNRITLPKRIIKKIGSLPDYEVAYLAGVSKTVIARVRKKLGIISYAEQTGNDGKIKEGDNHRRWNWQQKDLLKKYGPRSALRRIS